MEAATSAEARRPIEGEKAQRIVEAMRACVALRGVAGATFDHVAREAGVSRGLLHYYFGTKERLLAEVVRRDCDVRMALLDEQVGAASSADDFIALLRVALEDFVRDSPELIAVTFEFSALARRNDEIAAEFAELLRRLREHIAGLLAAKEAEGVLHLHGHPDAIADVLFSLADGIALRMVAEPERDWAATIETATVAVRALLTDR
jgi:AcrR family transcriptional regulator